MAAARLGLSTHIYSDVPGPASDVAAATTIAPYDDRAALEAFAGKVAAVTYEFENVPVDTALRLEARTLLRPGSRALEVSQDRLSEKRFLERLGLAVASYVTIEAPDDIAGALAHWGEPAILKTRRLGYDGKGQISLLPGDDAAKAFAAVGRRPAVMERRLSFVAEYSVLLVRGADGASAVYDLPRNEHSGGILRRSLVPGGLDAGLQEQAVKAAKRIADALDYVGLLAVELFDLGPEHPAEDRLLFNEIAPRVHNSGHWTLEACPVSQFENHMRAVAGWPLGSTVRHHDAEMVNLIGADADDWRKLAAEPGTALHLYGKGDARPGRKMGHVTRLRS